MPLSLLAIPGVVILIIFGIWTFAVILTIALFAYIAIKEVLVKMY